MTIFLAMMFRWPAPLAVAQILWIHLICDGPSDIVLGFEPKEEGIMDEKPKSTKEPVLAPLGLTLIGVISIGSAIAALSLFGHFFLSHGSQVEGRSLVFASFAVNSMIYIFAYRSMRLPLFRASPLSRNKPLVLAVIAGLLMVMIAFAIPSLRTLLGIVPLTLQQWSWIAAIAVGMLMAVEIGKWVRNLVKRRLRAGK
jgi:Ca2+-transporting ATPase